VLTKVLAPVQQLVVVEGIGAVMVGRDPTTIGRTHVAIVWAAARTHPVLRVIDIDVQRELEILQEGDVGIARQAEGIAIVIVNH